MSWSMPTRFSTRSTAGAVTASRSTASLTLARREARTRAVTPAESRNVVAVRSTTRQDAPALSADSSASRKLSAFVRSISPAAAITAVWPDHVVGKRSSDTSNHRHFAIEEGGPRLRTRKRQPLRRAGTERHYHGAELTGELPDRYRADSSSRVVETRFRGRDA